MLPNIIPLQTIGELANITGVPYSYINNIIKLKEDSYRSFSISKRSSNTKRKIFVPKPMLMKVQKAINRYILQNIQPHPIATAYSYGSNPIKNAAYHCNSSILLKFDIKDFFHSFDERDVYYLFLSFGYNRLLSFQLARLCTKIVESTWFPNEYKDHYIYPSLTIKKKSTFLPQGCPTSPMLSNLLMRTFDNKLEMLANKFSLKCTRYSDDLTFSSESKMSQDSIKIVIAEVNKMLGKKFRMNREKQKVYHKGQRKIVTGLIVNNDTPKLTKAFKNDLRMHVHFIAKYGYVEHALKRNCDPFSFYNHFNGRIKWAELIEPAFVNKLKHLLVNISIPFTYSAE
ncbi:RNA-directed DNA polymerase [Leptospira yasudae]|uniref:reverse transcriptase family protein n=1 Tax=Leptospira yasudae TaxID=2202201 RepID=UPI001C4EF299|nr:reverse transcriptase family protein [Leptospira yasudae]MBW0436041.1 RNA-directed DNA polymerase [Leptospira yasudae]